VFENAMSICYNEGNQNQHPAEIRETFLAPCPLQNAVLTLKAVSAQECNRKSECHAFGLNVALQLQLPLKRST
jgi:hypothetical protein